MKKSKFSFKNFKMSVSAANIKTWEQYFFKNLSSTCKFDNTEIALNLTDVTIELQAQDSQYCIQ